MKFSTWIRGVTGVDPDLDIYPTGVPNRRILSFGEHMFLSKNTLIFQFISPGTYKFWTYTQRVHSRRVL